MIVHFDKESGKVLWVNTYQSRQEAQSRLDEETIWVEETMPEAEDREGYRSVLYLREDGQGLPKEKRQRKKRYWRRWRKAMTPCARKGRIW